MRTWLVVLCACGRLDFDERPDATVAADIGIDAAPVRCNWNDGPTFGAVTRHPSLDTTEYEIDPILVRGDPLTIYLGAGAPANVFTATRPALDKPFGIRTSVSELASADLETGVAVDTSGAGYMVRGTASANIVEIRRDNGVFATVRELTELDAGNSEVDPWVSADNLELWFAEMTPGDQNIFIATRSSVTDPWGNVQPFVHNTALAEASPTLSVDRLAVVWTFVESGTGPAHLRYATRPTVNDAWSAPQTFPFAAAHEVEPALREDGCELFFSTATAFNAQWDIASVTVSTP